MLVYFGKFTGGLKTLTISVVNKINQLQTLKNTTINTISHSLLKKQLHEQINMENVL